MYTTYVWTGIWVRTLAGLRSNLSFQCGASQRYPEKNINAQCHMLSHSEVSWLVPSWKRRGTIHTGGIIKSAVDKRKWCWMVCLPPGVSAPRVCTLVEIISMGANEPNERRTEVVLSEKNRRYLISTKGGSVHMLPDRDANCIPRWLKNWHLHAALTA